MNIIFGIIILFILILIITALILSKEDGDIIERGESTIYCPDKVKHIKQYFECQPGTWKCHRCGAVYGNVGIFNMDIITKGKL